MTLESVVPGVHDIVFGAFLGAVLGALFGFLAMIIHDRRKNSCNEKKIKSILNDEFFRIHSMLVLDREIFLNRILRTKDKSEIFIENASALERILYRFDAKNCVMVLSTIIQHEHLMRLSNSDIQTILNIKFMLDDYNVEMEIVFGFLGEKPTPLVFDSEKKNLDLVRLPSSVRYADKITKQTLEKYNDLLNKLNWIDEPIHKTQKKRNAFITKNWTKHKLHDSVQNCGS